MEPLDAVSLPDSPIGRLLLEQDLLTVSVLRFLSPEQLVEGQLISHRFQTLISNDSALKKLVASGRYWQKAKQLYGRLESPWTEDLSLKTNTLLETVKERLLELRERARDCPDPDLRGKSLVRVSSQLLRLDENEAYQTAKQVANPAGYVKAMVRIARQAKSEGLKERAMVRALKAVGEISMDSAKEEARAWAAYGLASSSCSEAIGMVKAIHSPYWHLRASLWVEKEADLERLDHFLQAASTIPDPYWMARAKSEIAQELARKDSSRAMNVVRSLSPKENYLKIKAAAAIAGRLSAHARKALLEEAWSWTLQLKEPFWRDKAAARIVGPLSLSDYQLASERAGAIKGEVRRTLAFFSISQHLSGDSKGFGQIE